MAYSTTKKKLAFRILASIFLIGTFGFMFVPSIMITTTTTTPEGKYKKSDSYTAAAIVLGAFDKEDQKTASYVNDKGYEGEKVAYYMKTVGEELKLSDKKTTTLFAFVIVMSVCFAVMAGIANIVSLFNIGNKWLKFLNSFIAFFIVASTICAIISFAMSFYWVSGSYSANSGTSVVRTSVKSYGYLGLLINMLAPILAFVFFQDRELKE